MCSSCSFSILFLNTYVSVNVGYDFTENCHVASAQHELDQEECSILHNMALGERRTVVAVIAAILFGAAGAVATDVYMTQT